MVRSRGDRLHHRRRARQARSAFPESRQGGLERIQAGAPGTVGGRQGGREGGGGQEGVFRESGQEIGRLAFVGLGLPERAGPNEATQVYNQAISGWGRSP